MKFVIWSVASCDVSQTMLAIVSIHQYWKNGKQTSEAAHTSRSRCPLCWACGYSWNHRCVHGLSYPFDCRLPMDTAEMHAASCSDALGWLSYSLQAAYLVVHWNVKRLCWISTSHLVPVLNSVPEHCTLRESFITLDMIHCIILPICIAISPDA